MDARFVAADAHAVMRKIEDVIVEFFKLLESQSPLALRLPTSSAGSVLPLNKQTLQRFTHALKLLSEIYALLANGQFSTKRDLYYQGALMYKDQGAVDRIVKLLCQILEESRINLHVLSTAKGLLMGDVEYEEWGGREVECRSGQVLISGQVEWVRRIRGAARFILVVEKDAIFQKLLEEKFCQRHGPCILMTGKGYPDIGSRVMLKKLVLALHIPVFALMDADPHGVEILTTYKYGTKCPSFENRHLEIPSMKWIGVLRSEISGLPVREDQFIPLTEIEERKIEKLKLRHAIQEDPFITSQLSCLQRTGSKLEIEAISGIRPFYLSDVYLQSKLI